MTDKMIERFEFLCARIDTLDKLPHEKRPKTLDQALAVKEVREGWEKEAREIYRRLTYTERQQIEHAGRKPGFVR